MKNDEYYNLRQINIVEQRNKNVREIGISEYAGKPFLEMDEAERKMSDLIKSDEPFLVARIGETEMRTISEYQSHRWLKKSCRIASYCICNNAGFFPNNPFAINKFCKFYLNSIYDIDYLALFAWPSEEKYLEKSQKLKGSFVSRVVDVLQCDYKWSRALKGKRVLVVSPFEESIKKQYLKKDLIMKKAGDVLPDFELLTYKAVQSIGGKGAEGYKSWFEALSYMEQEIGKMDFDIALLGCGAYGVPLGAYIKALGKQAIVIGGCLQLMFGINGKRWSNDKVITDIVNEYWVYPSDEERPVRADEVEGGCYW